MPEPSRYTWACPGWPTSATGFGPFLRQLRAEAGLSQEQLAARLGTTQSAVARWERGRGRPRLETLERLAVVLQADVLMTVKGTATS